MEHFHDDDESLFLFPAVKDPRCTEFKRDRHRSYRNRNFEDVQAGQHGQQGKDYQWQQRQPSFIRSVCVWAKRGNLEKRLTVTEGRYANVLYACADNEESCWQLKGQKQLLLESGFTFPVEGSHTYSVLAPRQSMLIEVRRFSQTAVKAWLEHSVRLLFWITSCRQVRKDLNHTLTSFIGRIEAIVSVSYFIHYCFNLNLCEPEVFFFFYFANSWAFIFVSIWHISLQFRCVFIFTGWSSSVWPNPNSSITPTASLFPYIYPSIRRDIEKYYFQIRTLLILMTSSLVADHLY